jgi:amidase
VLLATAHPAPRHFSLVEATIPEIVGALETHRINSEQLVKLYLGRIAAYERTLNAMITVNPDAVAVAHERDVERAHGDIRGRCTAYRSSSRTTSTRST